MGIVFRHKAEWCCVFHVALVFIYILKVTKSLFADLWLLIVQWYIANAGSSKIKD